MPNAMSHTERQRFLADLHVGVLTVATGGDNPATLAVPIWYQYAPEVGVSVLTSLTSRKGAAMKTTGRFGLAVQNESIPYAYVSVEGPVVDIRPCELERDLLPMAIRYFGREAGTLYAEQWQAANSGDDHVFVMRPEQWWTADFTSDFADLATPA